MGEIKSVKVDNWGVFFLQKLQNFFNKTDFCDLTLQFKDNSQLKVHRLVLSACTDFFNVLEQTCELMDDALVMPAELQADVVVPIVNFMYTGTLEFELKMYGKLLRTAKEMNMTVLLKLLEAHKRTMEGTRATTMATNQTPKKPRIPPNQNTKVIQAPQTVKVAQPQSQRIQIIHSITPQRRTVMKPVQDRNTLKPAAAAQTILKPAPRLQRGPTRFEEPTSTHSETYESSFDSISYESKPLKEEPDEYTDEQTTTQWNRSSPFEQLRKGFNNNKRPAVATFTSPPAKKPNIEDVKEFSEQQRMRKQIAAEFGDDAEFDSIMDDEFHNDDDDEEPPHHHVQNTHPSSSSKVVRQVSQQQQQNQQSSVIIKQSPNEKPTIVVKDSSNSKMDHAKLISEVLRQYPHLVKSNKNIKLKIMPNVGGQSQKIIVKKETIDNMSAEMEQNNQPEKPQSRQIQFGLPKQQQQMHQQSIIKKPLRSYTASQTVKAVENQASVSNAFKNTTNEAKPAPSSAPQKRRIDSKTMHALIAQGAENTTGPWLCLRCGVNGRPISIPSYRGFRRHLINTHKEAIDSALCEHCGWRSKTNRELHHHMLVEHQVASLLYTFAQCKECNKICLNENDLQAHSEQYHPDSHKQQCIYCNKVFLKEMALYTHMKTFHKKRAREDGVIDFSDDEMDLDLESARSGRATSASGDSKIKILSDISLPSTLLKLENPVTTEEDDYGNDSGPKFVNADGNEMVLTAEQREEIMSQLDQDHDGGVVMVLNESVFPPEEAEGEGGGLVKLEAGETEHPIDFDEQNSQFLAASDIDLRGTEMSTEEHVGEETISKDAADDEATHADEQEENQESDDEHENDNDEHLDDDDHMEWAENLISAHDAHDDEEIDEHKDAEEKENEGEKLKKQKDEKDVKEKEKVSLSKSPKEDKPDAKKAEDINLKLKMLTGDWTDDEIDEEDETNEELPKDQEKTEEPETTATSKTSESDKTKPDDIEIKQSESMEEYGHEPELDANNSLIADDEITQSSHSEKVEEEHEIKEEVEEDVQLESAVNEDIVSESEVSAPATEEKEEESISEQVKYQGRTSRRTSSNKESDLNKTPTEDSPDAAKTAEDETEKTEAVDKEKDTTSTAADDEEANTSTKSVEEESSTTPDKVKSLLNEWVDDDDDL